jgi:NACHT domain
MSILLECYDRYEKYSQDPSSNTSLTVDEKKKEQENVLQQERLIMGNTFLSEGSWISANTVYSDKVARRIQKWIDAPDWEDILDKSLSRKAVGSCDWFADHTVYKRWESYALTQARFPETHQNILVVRGKCIRSNLTHFDRIRLTRSTGKPGYGKTILCASLIERLRDNGKAIVAYYFFDKGSRAISVANAFRAILAQVVASQHDDKAYLDIASLFLERKQSNKLRATQEQILSILRIYLQTMPKVILIFDGIDECEDHSDFFQSLRTVLFNVSDSTRVEVNARGCATLLLSRPDVKIPPSLEAKSSVITLHSGQNLSDIQLYMLPKLQEMIDGNVLVLDTSIHDVVKQTAFHANGMFLWATLLIGYLQCDGLTIQDRLDALNNLTYLAELNNLYEAIIQRLKHRLPPKSISNLCQIFRLVYGAFRPLHINELTAALRVSDGNSSSNSRTIPDLEKSLGSMSGSLLELASDQTVRFIHTSVPEFLCNQHRDNVTNSDIEFDIGGNHTQLIIARSCLLYLCHDVPCEPLSGSSGVTADKDLVRRQFPFLEYSVSYWSKHVCRIIDQRKGVDSSTKNLIKDDVLTGEFLEQMAELAGCKERLSLWIEAAWTFGKPPTLHELSQLLGKWRPPRGFSRPKTKKLEILKEKVSLLDMELQMLEQNWDHVLASAPNEIWEPSIPAFMNPMFLVNDKKARVAHLELEDRTRTSLLVASGVSSDGLYVGTVKLLLPE